MGVDGWIRRALVAASGNMIGGNKRVWGNVLVAGDAAVMDQIERMFREGQNSK